MVQTKKDFLHISDPIFLTFIVLKQLSERWGQKDRLDQVSAYGPVFFACLVYFAVDFASEWHQLCKRKY
jgi:hypothetical protein